jgi:hypothetical protein
MSVETVRVIREILPGVHERALRELRALIAYSRPHLRWPSCESNALGCSCRWSPAHPRVSRAAKHTRPNASSERQEARTGPLASSSAAPTAPGCTP